MERLLLISSDYQPSYGGIGIHTKNLIAELNKQNIKITLLVARMKVAENYKYPSEAFYQEKETPVCTPAITMSNTPTSRKNNITIIMIPSYFITPK